MRTFRLGFALAALSLASAPAFADALKIGQPAPVFTGTDSNGHAVSLADLKGKTVVLEWTNDGCAPMWVNGTAAGPCSKCSRTPPASASCG
jgi:hypothetical protein